MAAPTPLRPQLFNPSELQWTDATAISVKVGPKWINAKGLPNILLKGNVKFLSTTESGKQRIGLAIAKEDAESLSTFCATHLKPALANALAIPEPDATALGRKAPAYKKQKTSPTTPTVPAIALGRKTSPTAPPAALELKFSYSQDKFDATKAIVNFTANAITKFHRVDLETHSVADADGITQNANTEATCWLGISKSEKDEGVYYVNLMPKQVVFVESTAPPKEEEAVPVTFGGMSFN